MDLSGLSLKGRNLADADFAAACLEGCDLTGAKLAQADLSGADLTGAIGLTQAMIDVASTNIATKLPDGLRPGAKLAIRR